MTLQSSGAITMAQINTEFARGNNLNSYRGTTWYTNAGSSGTFSSGAITFNDFYSKRLSSPVTPGSQTFYSSGTFTVPGHNTLTAQVWGGGAGGTSGAGYVFQFGGTGGNSSWNSSVVGNGAYRGTGGTASGGTTNTTGGAGVSGGNRNPPSGAGGNSPNGGTGGAGTSTLGVGNNGNVPGGGGGGGYVEDYLSFPVGSFPVGLCGAGGGGGGYSTRSYSAGTYGVGSGVSVVVGGGGAGGVGDYGDSGGAGAQGQVTISWS